MKAFVEFYKREGISPVGQDITDLEAHVRRRRVLYRHLGIVPGLLEGKSVLEFGPGSGHNSIVTALMEPSRYVLVDANPTGLERLRQLMDGLELPGELVIEESFIEHFESADRFDLVLCEGVLPAQEAPIALLEHVASFVRPGGVLVTTSIDGISYFAEQLRRFVGDLLTGADDSTAAKLAVLVPMFGPHLATIEGMGRSHEDWILDNLIQPFAGRDLLGFDQAIEALDPAFSVLGCSPRFLTDWRWYKRVSGPLRELNDWAVRGYEKQCHNFLDSRVPGYERAAADNRVLLDACGAVFQSICSHSAERTDARKQQVLEDLAVAREAIDGMSSRTVQSMDDCLAVIDAVEGGARERLPWGDVTSWFGQGQQYLSMIRDA